MTTKHNPLKGKTILLVNTGSTKKRFILQRIKKLGVKVVALNKEKNWAESYVDHWIIADTQNHSEALQAVKTFIRQNTNIHIDGALTFWEDDVLLTSKITDRFNFIGIPYDVSREVRNKHRFREFCKQHGVSAPKFKKVESQKDFDYVCRYFKFPLVIKPVYGSSSAFVVKVDNKEELLKTFQYIKKNLSLELESALHEGLDILVEEYIDGEEVDVDILVQNGKTKFISISDNTKTEEPFFLETGRTTPSVLPGFAQDGLKEFVEEVLEKLGIQHGCIHFEAKWTKDGPWPIEVNMRMGGDEIYTSVKRVWGVDLIEHAIMIATGVFIKPIHPEQPKLHMSSMDFVPKNSGVLIELDVDKELAKKPYIDHIEVFKKIGDPILVPPEGYEYLGWMTVTGDNHVAAQENLRDALTFVNYRVAKYHRTSSVGKTERDTEFATASVLRRQLKGEAKLRKLQTLSTSAKLPSLNIGILYNDLSSKVNGTNGHKHRKHPSLEICNDVRDALESKGHHVLMYDMNDTIGTFFRLNNDDVDLVFNLCDQINGFGLLEPHSAALLDMLEVPYTGSSSFALSLTKDKIKTKKFLEYHNIPTAKFDFVFSEEESVNQDLQYPLIVKPANSEDSIGITNDSVVTNEEELKKQIRFVLKETKQPALIEEFIDGYELDVGIIGNGKDVKALPIQRTVFDKLPKGYWGIYPYEAKWGHNPVYDKHLAVERPARLTENQTKIVSEIAIDVYNMLDCHDYGRVEMRMDREGNFYVIELNANPSLFKNGYFSKVAPLIGMSYEDVIEEIVRATIIRYMYQSPYHHLQSALTVY